MTTEEELAQHVAAGARLLDDNNPGWWRHVAAETIHTAGCLDDVLGQVYGEWNTGMNALFDEYDDAAWAERILIAIDHGFEAPAAAVSGAADEESMTEEYRDLDDLWASEVLIRQDRDHEGGRLAPA